MFTIDATSQEASIERWIVTPAFGINFFLTDLPGSEPVEQLINLDGYTSYLQFVAVDYFINEKWGVGFFYRSGSNVALYQREAMFSEALKQIYGDAYFINTFTGITQERASVSVSRGMVSLVRRINKSDFLILPKLSLGSTSFDTNWAQAYLKERDANRVISISYTPDDISRDYFTVAGSALIGYRLSRSIMVSMEGMISYFQFKATYASETIDLASELVMEQSTSTYNQPIFGLSIGVGLLVVLKHR